MIGLSRCLLPRALAHKGWSNHSVCPSVDLFVCQFVSLFGYTKMSTLSEVGKHAMCTYHVRGRNEKIVASTYLTSESVLRRARKRGLFLLL